VSSEEVDLSQIRGDWDFHARYVTNAMEQTLKRQNKLWKALKKASKKKGQVPVDSLLMEDFSEACRQTRALTDDFWLLAETQGSAKKTKKKAKKKAKKKTKKNAAKKTAPKKKGGGK
jgi:cysteinyl-tRNA synthetase